MNRTAANRFDKSSTAEAVVAGIDLTDKLVLITGVNSGIGNETLQQLSRRGATVIATARSLDKARTACAGVSGATIPLACELEQQDSIRACAAQIAALERPLDICIANAGIMALPRLERVNGIEKQFATNHLGHFLLINLLREQIEAASAARIVIVSSAAHVQAPKEGIAFDNLSGEHGYSSWRAYGQSKLANILFAKALARRLAGRATANALHPGVIGTNLGRHMNPLLGSALGVLMKPFGKSIAQGAATSCYVAVRPEVTGITGQYFADCAVREPSRLARDEALGERLWEVSEQLTGLN
jgi:NAD(P)-dependent dehydrogenase (short-subunit alcohol dehydrogenase family)